MLVLATTGETAFLYNNRRTRQRAQFLLGSLRGLRIGDSTIEDARPLLNLYRAEKLVGDDSSCPPGQTTYAIRIANDMINKLGSRYPVLRKVGARPWGIIASLTFAGDKLCKFDYSARAVLQSSEPGAEISVTTYMQSASEAPAAHPDYLIVIGYDRKPYLVHRTRVVLTPKATAEEVAHAFSYDLSCFTAIRGCQTFCQIVPMVANDAFQRHKLERLPIPAEEALHPSCTQFIR